MRAKKRVLIAGEVVGGEIPADLLFQYAIQDKTQPKNWPAIAAKSGISDHTIAENYFQELTIPVRPSNRWSADEISKIDHIIDTGKAMKSLDLQMMFPARSLKAIRTKIQERKKLSQIGGYFDENCGTSQQ